MSHLFMRLSIFIVVMLAGILQLNAQHVADLFDDLDNDSAVADFKTPELGEFLDAALAYHAYHRMQDAQMRNFESQVKAKKREWMDHFYIDADTRYGLYNYILVTGSSSSPGIAPTDNQYSYYIAFSVRMPLSVFTKTKHEIRSLQHTVDQHKAYQEQLDDELMRIVIEEYYLMRAFREQMFAHQDVMQTVRSIYLKALGDFERGYVSLEAVVDIAESKAKAETDFYKAKFEFFMHAEKLFALTGYKLKPSAK